MRAVLKMELIGEDFFMYEQDKRKKGTHSEHIERRGTRLGLDKKRPWVAKLLSYDGYLNFEREFVNGQRDFANANGTGSRGIFIYYPLQPGLYEVHERPTWRRTRRYFIRVEGIKIIEISKEEVIKCLPKTILA